MESTKFSWSTRGVSILVLLSLLACSKEPSTSPEETPVEKDYLALGWSNFESHKYDSAVTNFTTAYNQALTPIVRGEALCGRGWTNAYRRDVSKAQSDFAFALGLTGMSPSLRADLHAGGAFALYSLNDFSKAASYADSVLVSNASYVFSHDSRVTARRIRILLAECYYGSGQFSQSAQQLDLLDPAGAPHASDPVALLAGITVLLNSL